MGPTRRAVQLPEKSHPQLYASLVSA